MTKPVPKFSIDAASLTLRSFEASLRVLAKAGAAEVCFVISDGGTTPLVGAGPALVAAAGGLGLARHVHLIVAHPERHVNTFAMMRCERLSFQLEGCVHAHQALVEIRDAGMSAGIAVSPCTPLTRLDYVLEMTDRVLLLGLEPGVTEGVARGALLERVKLLEDNIRYRELQTGITVGGGLDVPTMAKAAHLGAKTIVLGADADGWDGGKPEASLAALHRALAAAMKTA